NPPGPVHRDRPLASAVALERMQSNALEWTDLIQALGCAQYCQQLQRRVGIETSKAALPGLEQPPRRRIAPRLAPRPDHAGMLLRLAYYVKRISCLPAHAPHQPRRPRRAEQRNEFASWLHSMTSSASASSVGATSSPSALAVL